MEKRNNIEIDGKLIRYSMQLILLKKIEKAGLLTKNELQRVKAQLMSDYNIVSDMTAK